MSEAAVSYSCGSCGYPLNLSSSNRMISSSCNDKSAKKGLILFVSVDLSRFTQVDNVNCFPVHWGQHRLKTKLLCRKCSVLIGYGYGHPPMFTCFNSSSNSLTSNYRKFALKIQALQPLQES